MKNTIEQLEDKVNEIETEVNKLDAKNEKTEPAYQRKMRFATQPESLRGVGGTWIPNRNRLPIEKLDDARQFESLALGRMVVEARGGHLPDDHEHRFQDLAGQWQKRTMMTSGTGTGAELVDTVMWQNLFEDVRAATLVAGLFPSIDMPSGSIEISEMGDSVFYKPAGEAQAVTATDLVTAKRTLTAYTLKSQVDISDEESEDAVVALIPEIRGTLLRNCRELIDELILNADTTTSTSNINQYGGSIASSSRFLVGFNGLLHYPLVEISSLATSLTTLESADFVALISLLGKYGDVPKSLAFICDRWVKNKALSLDDFRTVDKIGTQATILTGQIGQAYGVPVVMSPQIAKADSSGYVNNSAGSNTLGRLLLVNRDMWRVGYRRRMRVAVERDEAKGLTSLVCTLRMGLQCFGDRSSANYCHTALGYNVTV